MARNPWAPGWSNPKVDSRWALQTGSNNDFQWVFSGQVTAESTVLSIGEYGSLSDTGPQGFTFSFFDPRKERNGLLLLIWNVYNSLIIDVETFI